MRVPWLVFTCVAAAAMAGAEERAPVAFHSAVDLVALNVTVTDGHRGFVSDLAGEDFVVLEDGVPQQLSLFAIERAPLDLTIVLDASASMTEILPEARRAAIGLIKTLRSGDRVGVVGIHDQTDVLHALDEDLDGAVSAIQQTAASGTTALYDSVYIVVTDMKRKRPPAGEIRRQAVVLLSDGADTRSLVDYDDLMQLVKDAGIGVYSIDLHWPYEPPVSMYARTQAFLNPHFVMRSLAQDTGGRYFDATRVSDLAAVYTAIADELAHQYTLGYISSNPRHDGAFRHVVVRVADHPQCIARTRGGYRAPRPDQRTR